MPFWFVVVGESQDLSPGPLNAENAIKNPRVLLLFDFAIICLFTLDLSSLRKVKTSLNSLLQFRVKKECIVIRRVRCLRNKTLFRNRFHVISVIQNVENYFGWVWTRRCGLYPGVDRGENLHTYLRELLNCMFQICILIDFR